MPTKISAKDVATPDMLNAIRNEASPAYQNAVPIATRANLTDVGNPILTYQSIQNEFLNALVNRIALTIVNRNMFANPLAFLKKGAMPLGLDVQEIYTNPSEGQTYESGTMNGILTPVNPDVKAAYYRRNRRDMYKVTIYNEQLSAAFISWGNLEQLIGSIVDSLYNGNTIGEFNLTKQLLGDAAVAKKIVQNKLALPVDEVTARGFSGRLRQLSMNMGFPSSDYNSWALPEVGGTGNPVTTWTDKSNIIIIIRSDVAAQVDVNLLAAAFNLSYADYIARQVIVDEFNNADNMFAFIGDVEIFQIRENLRKMTEFYNSEKMAWTYWWHCWDTYALSPFKNGVALVTELYT